MGINIQSDNILADLKRECLKQQQKGDKKQYLIPKRGLFKYVSNANYLGEIIEFFGYGLISLTWPGFFFCFTTFMILGARGLDNHNWYLKNFRDYPKNRKAVIPKIL
ncbi:hypothetical protein PPERSA_05738 [Pseudocohnilembus persalinus]|uniref:3-oxo-5-alpha-steroid 4-dehydrogenase C-terminal domain-containing protein n=1 Tax=Pseudocohnilembus persalinus TaxID=266149 RepID=A0A0V0QIC0_PSEPJ|nr:hypothetical protein PPERSA_05738 [Pseudocohnilembus persalinus]|eukprot:KRX01899.1 hypothetical protein PPERSA_05738 [Pseudocohnilembus persalinus]